MVSRRFVSCSAIGSIQVSPCS